MRRQCELKPTSKRRAMNGRNNRLWRGFYGIAHSGQPWVLGRFAELCDIRSGRKGAALTIDQKGIDPAIRKCLFNPLGKSLANSGADSVNRGIADCEDRNTVSDLVANDFAHVPWPPCPFPSLAQQSILGLTPNGASLQ